MLPLHVPRTGYTFLIRNLIMVRLINRPDSLRGGFNFTEKRYSYENDRTENSGRRPVIA